MKRVYLLELQNVRPQLDKGFDFGHCVRIVKMTSSMQDWADHALGCKLRVFPDRWAMIRDGVKFERWGQVYVWGEFAENLRDVHK